MVQRCSSHDFRSAEHPVAAIISPMEIVQHLFALGIDFIVNIDEHLMRFVAAYGAWIYVLLFAIIFTETGVADMNRSKFTMFNVAGAFIWVLGIVPGLMAIFGAWKAGRAEKAKAGT